MQRTSLHGSSRRKPNGYVLIEVLAVLVVLGIGGVAVLSAVAEGMNAVHRQSTETAQIIRERNEKAKTDMADIASQ